MSPWSSTAIRRASGRRAGCSRSTCVLINLFVVPIAAGRPAAARPAGQPRPLRAAAAAHPRRELAVGLRLHRRPVGGDLDGDRGLHGALRHDRQRAGHALPAAPQRAGGRRAARHGPAGGVRAPRRRRADPDGGLRLRAHHLGLPAARLDRPDQLLRRRQLRARRRARPLLAARPPLRRRGRPGRRLRRLALRAAAADAAPERRRRPGGAAASPTCRRRSPSSIRSGRASSSASWSMPCCWSASRCWCARAARTPSRPTPSCSAPIPRRRAAAAPGAGRRRAHRRTARASGALRRRGARRCGRWPASGCPSRWRSRRTERVLSGTLGAASARIIVAAFGRRGRLLPRSARALIDEASEAIRYNYEILRNTLDHVGMGIAAFDRDGRLEIFNDRFTTLLSLDDASVAVGAAPHGVRRHVRCRGPAAPARGAADPRDHHPRRPRHRAAARPAARRRLRRHLQRRDGARAHRRGAARKRPPASPVDRDPGAARDRAHRRARGEPRRGRGRQSRQDALHRRGQPRPAAAVARRAPVHRGDDRPRSRQRSRRQDRRQPGRGRIAARCAARHLQARCRRLQAGEAAVRPAAAVRLAGHRLRAGGGAPRRRAGGGADARLRVDRSGLPAPHPAEPAVQCAALRQGRGPAGRACCWAAAASARSCASRSRTTARASPPTSRRSSSTSSCACRPRTTRRARSAGWGWASPSSTASRACSTCRCGSPRRRGRARPSR